MNLNHVQVCLIWDMTPSRQVCQAADKVSRQISRQVLYLVEEQVCDQVSNQERCVWENLFMCFMKRACS
jgi:hypothetical protein